MGERLTSVFVPADEPQPSGETVRFVRTWAEEVLRQVERLETTRRRARWCYRGDEPGIDLEAVFREWWAAEHTLLWAAHQLERWSRRIDREQGAPEREMDPELKQARNVLEHLDMADFVGEQAVAPPWEPKKKGARDPYWSLRQRGGLDLGITDDGTFCGIASAELRARALDIVHSVEEYLYEGAADYLAQLDRHSPDDDELDYEP